MQNTESEKAEPWNPWHGCKKVSSGCKNCFVFKMDKRYGRDTTVIAKDKTTYELRDKDCPANSLVKLCFSSDFFLDEADEWRDGCRNFIRRRKECGSMFLKNGVNIVKFRLNEQIKCAEEIQHKLEETYR